MPSFMTLVSLKATEPETSRPVVPPCDSISFEPGTTACDMPVVVKPRRRFFFGLKPWRSSLESESPYLRSRTWRTRGSGNRLKSWICYMRSHLRMKANYWIVAYMSSGTFERR